MFGSLTAYAGQWQTEQRGWTYQNDDGTYAVNQWVYHNNVYYWVNSAGVMESNTWVNYKDRWYYLDSNGAMISNTAREIGGKWYRFNSDGSMVTGWHQDNGKWYFFDGSGAMLTGWQFINGQWYLLGGSDGSMNTGWAEVGGKWYYLFSDGHMAVGVQTVDGKEQLFKTNGEWIKDADTNNGQSTGATDTIDSLFNAAYEDMEWEDIESLASKYYSNFYQTSANAIDELNKWRATNNSSNVTLSSSLTKSAMALAITNKAFDYFGADAESTAGVTEWAECAEMFNASVEGIAMAKGDSLADAIQKLYNKEQLAVITKPKYTNCGFGFVRLDDGKYICAVLFN